MFDLTVTGRGGAFAATDSVRYGVPAPGPRWSVRFASPTAREDAGTTTLTVSAGTGFTFGEDKTVTLDYEAGSATRGEDFMAPATLTLREGESSVSTPVTLLDDRLVENETIEVRGRVNGEEIGSASLGIVDDDAWRLGVAVTPAGLAEGRTQDVRVTVTMRDGAGMAARADDCVAPFAVEFDIVLSGVDPSGYEVSNDDLAKLTGMRLDNCAVSVTETLEIEAKAANRTLVFTPDVTSAAIAADPPYAHGRGTLAMTDAPPVPVTVTPRSLTVDEGGSETYTIVLEEQPTGRVTVTVAGHAGTDVRLSKTRLFFTTGNYSDEQTVTVTAVEDSDAVDDTVTLTHDASGGGFGAYVLPDVTVTVADNDGGLHADPAALTIAEGGNGTYGLTLTRQPTGPVTVTVDAPAGVTVDPATLTFTDANWDTPQTVTVTGTQDTNKADATVTVRHAATGGGYAVTAGGARSAPVTVTVEDDDKTVPDPPEMLKASGSNESVRLTWTPGDDGGADITAYRYRVDDGTGFGTAQPAGGGGARRHTVLGLMNGTLYTFEVQAMNSLGWSLWSDPATGRPVPVPVIVSPLSLTVDEGSHGPGDPPGKAYTIVLTEQPTADVTVTVAGHAGTDVRLSKTRLFFTTGNYSDEQTVTVTAVEETADNMVDETVTLTHDASGGGFGGYNLPDVTVTVADNDGGLHADPAALTIAEGGNGTYALKLTRQPTGDVTVTVVAPAGVTADPATLTFTAANWNAAQTVRVTAVQDGDMEDETATLSHRATGGGYAVVAGDARSAPVAVTVRDDEAMPPGKPLKLKAAAGNESVTLTWEKPAEDGGSPVTGYEYQYRQAGGAWTDTGGTACSQSQGLCRRVTGLVNDTPYEFQVRARNRLGWGLWSDPATGTPVPLTLTLELLSEATITEGGLVSYCIRMSNPTSGVTVGSVFTYEGDFMLPSDAPVSTVTGISSGGHEGHKGPDDLCWPITRATVDDGEVEAHGKFTVRLQSREELARDDFDVVGGGYALGEPHTATVTILDDDGGEVAPDAPSPPVVTAVSPTMLDVTWQAPSDHDSPVTGYALEYREGRSGNWTGWPEPIAAGTLELRLEGLARGAEHEVRVRAENARGEGPWSEPGRGSTAPDPGVTVSIEARKGVWTKEGATLAFTVRAEPAQTRALTVAVAVTETVDMIAGLVPTSVTIKAGQGSVKLKVRTENDAADEGDSVVTATLQPSVRYVLGTARASYTVRDDEPDTLRGQPLNPRAEAIPKPGFPQDLVDEPVLAFRVSWEPPSDVALAHQRGWWVEWARAGSCAEAAPAADGAWPESSGLLEVERTEVERTESVQHIAPGAVHFRVAALLTGAGRGAWSEPVCADTADYGSGRAGASGPAVTGARIVSGPGDDGAWRAGEAVDAAVVFSEPVTVDTAGGTPTLAIVLGGERRTAAWSGGSGTASLIFRHVVEEADAGARSARVVAGGLSLNGGTIRNGAGANAVLGFALAPVVTSVEVALDPDGDGRWSAGEAVTVTFRFSDVVAVATEDGTPSVGVLAGGGPRAAAYAGGSGTAALAFAYTVTADDGTVRAVLVPANGLSLNGGAIAGPTGLAAVLAHAGAGRTGAPAAGPPALSVADAAAAEGAALAFRVTLDRPAAAPVTVDYATSDGTATAGEDYTEASGTLVFAPGETAKTVEIAVLDDALDEGGETMGLALSNAAGAGIARGAATGAIADPAAPSGPPPALSVADAEAQEGPGAVLAFRVTLDRASAAPATVDWETLDGSATAGEDYVGASGTLAFAPGETAKTVEVAVLDDAHDEGRETMLLYLSNATGASIADAVAKGTIENTDLMPAAWLARFGRTVADQVIEAVEGRVRASRQAGFEARLAGQRIGGPAPADDVMRDAEAQARAEAMADWLRGGTDGTDEDGRLRAQTRTVTERDLLTGSSFALTAGTGSGGFATLWGAGAVSRFNGREDDLSLDGEVASAMLGADWSRDAWTAGMVIAHSRGSGDYRSPEGGGAVESTLTGLYPWGRYALTERLSVWGVAGYGAGSLTLTPKGGDGEDEKPLETDLDLTMAAAGLRGVVVEAPADGGPELAVTSDALVVRTGSAAISGGGGNLAAAEAEVTRLRLGLEGSYLLRLGEEGTLTPRLEIGVRHDGGVAETGFGSDIGAGLEWSDRKRGIEAELTGAPC